MPDYMERHELDKFKSDILEKSLFISTLNKFGFDTAYISHWHGFIRYEMSPKIDAHI